jgi:hypothetical protein
MEYLELKFILITFITSSVRCHESQLRILFCIKTFVLEHLKTVSLWSKHVAFQIIVKDCV